MSRVQVGLGLVVAALGLVVSCIGLNLAADFADLGEEAVARGDDGSIPALLLLPAGLLLVAAGVVVAILTRRFQSVP